MIVSKIGVLFCVLAVYQVNSAPAVGQPEFDGSFQRQYLPYIQATTADGTKTILTPQNLLDLSTRLQSEGSPSTTTYEIIGINGFSRILSDHHLDRLANREVMAIVDTKMLNQPGFGHLFITVDSEGTLKTFIYNMNLSEAFEKESADGGYPHSSSEGSYHRSPSPSSHTSVVSI
ncbi:uncharacterized protein LOC130672824 [Microplitis mediator]|uniref:uncharacterized protein LOC130672824 n=1 Tax=Microplitis mediator TaxID=375433 RepID=UPI002553DBE3|nr:uncharacterized protein LOC130672824 [Microplitis mediator]